MDLPSQCPHECLSFIPFIARDRIFAVIQVARTFHIRETELEEKKEKKENAEEEHYPACYLRHFTAPILAGHIVGVTFFFM